MKINTARATVIWIATSLALSAIAIVLLVMKYERGSMCAPEFPDTCNWFPDPLSLMLVVLALFGLNVLPALLLAGRERLVSMILAGGALIVFTTYCIARSV